MKTVGQTLLNDADFAAQVTPERVDESAKVWRNWWRVNQSFTCEDTGDVLMQGDEYPGMLHHQSQHEAQRWAERSQYNSTAWDGDIITRIPDTYLGAFPDGERP